LLAEASFGLMYQQQGHRDGPFCLSEPIAASVAGLIAATGGIAGILLRALKGRAHLIDTTYADAAIAAQSLSAAFPREQSPPVRRYHDPYSVAMAPAIRFYRAADGWLLIAALTYAQWRRLIELTGDSELIADPRLEIPPLSLTDQDLATRLTSGLAEWAHSRSRMDVLRECGERDLIAVPVLSHPEFLGHPQCIENNLFVDLVSPKGSTRIASNFVQMKPFKQASSGEARLMPSGLSGLTVLDFAAYVAAPNCGRILGDLGMKVIKIEAPGGDPWRYMGYSFAPTNRGKRSIAVDLKAAGAPNFLKRLLAQSDITISNLRPDAERRCGLAPDEIGASQPHVVCVHLSGLGMRGPYASRPAIDAAGQALAGASLAQGGGSEPVGFTSGTLDSSLGWLAALGILSALYRRLESGAGASIESGLLHAAALFQARSLVVPAVPGEPKVDRQRLGFSAYERLYRAADGWICVAATNVIERRALASIAGVARADRAPVNGKLARALAKRIGELSIADLGRTFEAAGVASWCVARTLEEAARSQDELFVEVTQEPWGQLLQPRRSVTFSGIDPGPLAGSPVLVGGDASQVLKEFGFGDEDLDELKSAGIIPPEPVRVAALPMNV
jgi:crotonobetainyl-CoA:carnitine CoA-transferase CaiB-like acyl-CoA transferase